MDTASIALTDVGLPTELADKIYTQTNTPPHASDGTTVPVTTTRHLQQCVSSLSGLD